MRRAIILISKFEVIHLFLQLCCSLILLGIGLLFLFHESPEKLIHWQYFVNISGGLILCFSVGSIMTIAHNWNHFNRMSYVLLHAYPKVVWVYPYETTYMPFGIKALRMTYLVVKLNDASSYSLMVNKKSLHKIMDALKQDLSHTTFGYSEDKAFFYRANPSLLLK